MTELHTDVMIKLLYCYGIVSRDRIMMHIRILLGNHIHMDELLQPLSFDS